MRGEGDGRDGDAERGRCGEREIQTVCGRKDTLITLVVTGYHIKGDVRSTAIRVIATQRADRAAVVRRYRSVPGWRPLQ